jgi:hypothetical protein
VCGEPGFEEDPLQLGEIGRSDREVAPDPLDSEMALVTAEVVPDLRLEAGPVGAERNSLQAGECGVSELILEIRLARHK